MEENNNFLYKGYLLVIGQYLEYYAGICKELNYASDSNNELELKSDFREYVTSTRR